MKEKEANLGLSGGSLILIMMGSVLFLIPVIGLLGALLVYVGVIVGLLRWQKEYDSLVKHKSGNILTSAMLAHHIWGKQYERKAKTVYISLAISPVFRLLHQHFAVMPIIALTVVLIALVTTNASEKKKKLSFTIREDSVLRTFQTEETDNDDGHVIITHMVEFEQYGTKTLDACQFVYCNDPIVKAATELQAGEAVYQVFSKDNGKLLCTYRKKEWQLAVDLAL